MPSACEPVPSARLIVYAPSNHTVSNWPPTMWKLEARFGPTFSTQNRARSPVLTSSGA